MGEVHARWGVGRRVRRAPGQGLCFPKASPTSAPSFCSPQQQRYSEQGLQRKQTASFLLKKAEKRAGTRKGMGKKALGVGTAAEGASMSKAPSRLFCASWIPRPNTLGGPTRQALHDFQMRTDLGTHTGSFSS